MQGRRRPTELFRLTAITVADAPTAVEPTLNTSSSSLGDTASRAVAVNTAPTTDIAPAADANDVAQRMRRKIASTAAGRSARCRVGSPAVRDEERANDGERPEAEAHRDHQRSSQCPGSEATTVRGSLGRSDRQMD